MSVDIPQTLARELAPRRARAIVVALAGCVLAVGAADWVMRIRWFRWHETLVLRPREAGAFDGPVRPLQVVQRPERHGGDLTRLIGLEAVARRFEEARPAAVDHSDEFGFHNLPSSADRTFDVVLAGDSFMGCGDSVADTPASRLSSVLGRPVYTYAYPGLGPVFAVTHFLGDERFRAHPPRTLVWGLVERELRGDVLEGLVEFLARGAVAPAAPAGPARPTVNLHALQPRQLARSLPDTSAAAHIAHKAWNALRYRLLGRLCPDVAVSERPIGGKPVLFYAHAARAMQWPREVRRPDQMLAAMSAFAAALRQRGIEPVILLIPDKEQVYRELLPPDLRDVDPPIPPSTLLDLEAGLRTAGIRVVNLLPAFRAAAARDQLIYWADDTHWNGAGIDLGVAELGRELSRLFDSPGERGDTAKP